MRASRQRNLPGGIAMAEEAVLLARSAPAGAWLCYYAGAVPFVLGLLYFWSDMSRGAFAARRCAPAALALALLFLGLKTGQAMFAARLTDQLARRSRPWSLGRLFRLVRLQCAWQPFGLLLLPLSSLAVLTFVPAQSLFQSLTVIGDGDDTDGRRVRRRAWRLAGTDLRAQTLLLWMLSPWVLFIAMFISFGLAWLLQMVGRSEFGSDAQFMFIAGSLIFLLLAWPLSPLGAVLLLNLGILFIYLPELLRLFLGWDTLLRLSGSHAVTNSTFLAALFAVTYLCLDPLLKAAYVIRCFREEALTNGRDLLVALDDLRAEREQAP